MKSNAIGAYKEIQIHGPVEFAKDIERVYISKNQLKMGDAKALLQQVKSFCSKHQIEYELFELDTNNIYAFGAMGPGIKAENLKADDRIVGDKKQLTEQDLKPPPPPAAPVFGGGLFGGVGGSIFGAPAASYPAYSFGATHFSFGDPVFAPPPPPPPKPKEYGIDYI